MKTPATIAFLALAVCTSAYAQPPAKLRIALSEEYAPWSSGTGDGVRGLARDLLTEILQERMGYSLTFVGYPWGRAQSEVIRGRADLICTAPSTERGRYTIATRSPLFTAPMRIYASNRPDVLHRLDGVHDLTSLNAAPVRFNLYVGAGWMRDHLDSTKIEVGGSLEQILTKLSMGRGDVVVENSLVVRYMIGRMGLGNTIVELAPTLDALHFHILVGNRSRLAADMPRLDSVVDQFLSSPGYQAILRHYP